MKFSVYIYLLVVLITSPSAWANQLEERVLESESLWENTDDSLGDSIFFGDSYYQWSGAVNRNYYRILKLEDTSAIIIQDAVELLDSTDNLTHVHFLSKIILEPNAQEPTHPYLTIAHCNYPLIDPAIYGLPTEQIANQIDLQKACSSFENQLHFIKTNK